jgi:transcriptional regulator with XRE-family HTH domain
MTTAFLTASVGERIREGRQARGLTQAELAVLIGVNHVAVSRWERGTHFPRWDMRTKLAKVLSREGFRYHSSDFAA